MKRPMIGLTAGLNHEETYLSVYRPCMDALCEFGAMPVLLPLTDDQELLEEYVETLDGVMFSGGSDVNPLLFGEMPLPVCGDISPVRDASELALARLLAQRKDKPVLGVCRGFQVMNIALGGDVYQDLPTQFEGKLIAHKQKQPDQYPSHPVELKADSKLARIVGADTLMVNSLHHQALRRMGEGWTPCAYAPDGVIEAAEKPDHAFFMGVQWHPERLWRTDQASRAIIGAFIGACARKAQD